MTACIADPNCQMASWQGPSTTQLACYIYNQAILPSQLKIQTSLPTSVIIKSATTTASATTAGKKNLSFLPKPIQIQTFFKANIDLS